MVQFKKIHSGSGIYRSGKGYLRTGSGATTLIISNEEMNDIMKII